MYDPSLDPGALGELAEEFLKRRQRGERPTVEDYAQQHPEVADQIRAFFPALLLIEDLKPALGDLTASFGGSPGVAHGLGLERLGDFRVIREVGRGGMGVVYEAEQESLGRRVALKVLVSPVLLDPQKLARFHREAKAAARLHHTNIVPVFGVGECDGVHYYVMQFIAGAGLDEVLADVRRLHRRFDGANAEPLGAADRDLSVAAARSLLDGPSSPPEPSPPPKAPSASPSGGGSPSVLSVATETGGCYARSVARIGIQVGDALAYAHEQGILHRDVKPSNILLDAHGNAWVTDFGLAKAAADDDLTHTGDIVGTVRYMAPERFHGRCDGRSDVYALGLTLYELLAHRPAFAAADRNTLIHQVSQQAPPRLRRLEPGIPRDLETIVHKAIEKEPAHRYPTADALVGDLRRFLEDRPILARRVSTSERLVRWGRRNPWVAALTAVVFLLLIAIAAGATQQAVRAREHAALLGQEAHRARQSAEAEARARHDAEGVQQVLRRTLYAAHLNLVEAAWESSNVGRVRSLLARERPAPGTADLRGWEWYYWDRLCSGALRTFTGLSGHAVGVAFSPDGRVIAAAGSDGSVALWDADSGAAVRRLSVVDGSLHGMAFSPDGTRIAVIGGRRDAASYVVVWDAVTGEKLRTTEGYPDQFRCVAFSADGRRLAAGGFGGRLTVWDAASGNPALQIDEDGSPIWAIAFTPDGTRFATSVDGMTMIRDAASGQTILTLNGHEGPVRTCAYSPDGKTIATGGVDRKVQFWDGATGRLLRTYAGHVGAIRGLQYSRDGTMLASASADQSVRVIDALDAHEIAAHFGHADQVMAVAFRADGRVLASASADRTVKTWNPRTRRDGLTTKLEGRALRFDQFIVSPDGTSIAAAVGAPGAGSRIDLLDVSDGRVRGTLRPPAARITGLAFSRDAAHVLTSSEDGTLRTWDASTGKEIRRFSGFGRVRGMTLSPDGTRIAVVGTPQLRILDVVTGADAGLAFDQALEADGVAYSPDGRQLATADDDHTVRIWDAATGAALFVGRGHSQPVHCVAFSPDGRLLASGGLDMSIRIWTVATGRERRVLEGHSHRIGSLAFSPDGRRLASASLEAVKLWDVDGDAEVLSLREQSHVAFSPDGSKLLTGGRDLTVRIWDGTPDTSQVELDENAGHFGSEPGETR